jgi:hypothetical protein
MPLVSLAQNRWARWAAENAPEKTAKVAREFISASPHGPGAYKNLPARVHKGKPSGKRRFGSIGARREK